MGSSVSTVTSKFQITLPEEIREKFQIGIGQKIQWEIQGEVLVGKRLPSLMDLAGCMKSDKPPATDVEIAGAWTKAAIARDQRTKNRK